VLLGILLRFQILTVDTLLELGEELLLLLLVQFKLPFAQTDLIIQELPL